LDNEATESAGAGIVTSTAFTAREQRIFAPAAGRNISCPFTRVGRLRHRLGDLIQMFAVLHGLHYGALAPTTEVVGATAGIAAEQGGWS
jgi:hypothetical protein